MSKKSHQELISQKTNDVHYEDNSKLDLNENNLENISSIY